MTAAYSSILKPEYRHNPYPLYAELRRGAPVFDADLTDSWIVTRYADVRSALLDSRFESGLRARSLDTARARFGRGLAAHVDVEGVLSNLARGERIRAHLRSLLPKSRLEALAPALRAKVRAILRRATRDGGIDLVRDFADQLPPHAVAALLGIPDADRERLRAWTEDLVWLATPTPVLPRDAVERIEATGRDMGAYLGALIAERRRSPRDDLLGDLIRAAACGDELTDPELVALLAELLAGASAAAPHLIGMSALWLLQAVEERRRIERDPSLVPRAAEEFARYDSPVQVLPRVTREDLEIRGARIAAGEGVLLVLGAANRDPDHFPDPDRLDVGRRPNRHLAFGTGPQQCPGAPLGRLELQLAVRGLLEDIPEFRFADYEFRWRSSVASRGLEQLILRL